MRLQTPADQAPDRAMPTWGLAKEDGWSIAIIVVALVAMVGVSWQKWADPIVDFGRELYVPWRLHEGDRLYRDITYQYSPLSPYVNLGWFKLFGVSYRSIVIGNGVLFAVLLSLCWFILRRIASRLTATAGILFVILVFAFGQYDPIANFNYLSPYAHEVTHGLVLSFVMLAALARYVESRSRSALALSGLALGLVFLTKYEVFFAAAGAATVGLATHWSSERGRSRFPVLSLFLGVAMIPSLACLGFLWAMGMTPASAWRATLGVYPLLLNRDVLSIPLFSWSSGFVAPARAVGGLFLWSVVYASCVLPPAFLWGRKSRPESRFLSFAAFVFPAVVILLLHGVDPNHRGVGPGGLSINPDAYVGGGLLPWRFALVPLPVALLLCWMHFYRSDGNLKPPRHRRAAWASA